MTVLIAKEPLNGQVQHKRHPIRKWFEWPPATQLGDFKWVRKPSEGGMSKLNAHWSNERL